MSTSSATPYVEALERQRHIDRAQYCKSFLVIHGYMGESAAQSVQKRIDAAKKEAKAKEAAK